MILLRWCGKSRLSNTTPLIGHGKSVIIILIGYSFIKRHLCTHQWHVSCVSCPHLSLSHARCHHQLLLSCDLIGCLLQCYIMLVQHFHHRHRHADDIKHVKISHSDIISTWHRQKRTRIELRSSYWTFCSQFRRTPSVSTIRTCNNSALTLYSDISCNTTTTTLQCIVVINK